MLQLFTIKDSKELCACVLKYCSEFNYIHFLIRMICSAGFLHRQSFVCQPKNSVLVLSEQSAFFSTCVPVSFVASAKLQIRVPFSFNNGLSFLCLSHRSQISSMHKCVHIVVLSTDCPPEQWISAALTMLP